jgi:mRNA interferase RelE/StbE
MAFIFVFTRSAKKDVASLDIVVRKQLHKKLVELAEYDNLSHVSKPLAGELNGYCRIRIGNYRVLCEIDGGEVVVHKVQHRKEVYR